MPEGPPPLLRSGRDLLVLAAGLLLFLVLGVTTATRTSAVYDEIVHFSAGYTWDRFGEFRFDPDHPPLVPRLAAAPLLAMDVRFPEDDAAWRLGRPYEVGRRFLYRWNDGDRLLLRGRVMVLLLAAGLVAAVYAWTRRHSGSAGGALSLLLAATSPDLLAHGSIVTTDLGAAAFIFFSVIAFERLTHGVTTLRLFALTAAVAGAAAAKFSALVLAPVLGLLALMVALRPEPIEMTAGGAHKTLATRRARVLAAAVLGAWLIVAAALALWALYGFRYAASLDAPFRAQIPWARLWPEDPWLGAAVWWAREHHVLPEAYLWGFLRFFEHQQARPAFLLGEISDHGFPLFFPVSFAVKTPVALLVLLGLAAWLAARRGMRARSDLFLIVPVALYAAISLTRDINIGHRHLLPLYPFLFVAAGRCAAWAAAAWPWRGPAVTVVGLAAWALGAALVIHPHHLSYFNEIVGGPSRGHAILVDSSLDWGQDLRSLRPYMERHGIPRVKLSYFGTADPAYYGIASDQLPSYLALPRDVVREVQPGDVLAVSATNLRGVYLEPQDRPLMERLQQETPIGRVGYSILVYRADFHWPPR